MNIKTVDDRIRQAARDAFNKKATEVLKGVTDLIQNQAPVKDLQYQGKDITNMKLIEVLKANLLDTQSVAIEEQAITAFMAEIQERHEKDPSEFPFLGGQ